MDLFSLVRTGDFDLEWETDRKFIKRSAGFNKRFSSIKKKATRRARRHFKRMVNAEED